MLKNLLKTPIRALFGPPHTWRYAVDAQRQCVDLRARLDDAFVWASENVKKCSDEPVFILSAGWRSGSTLLQRMLMQNNERILIWGEPFHQSNILDCMMNQFRCFTAEWPKERHFLSRRNDRKLSDQWIANLYPDVDFLIKCIWRRNYFYWPLRKPRIMYLKK